MDKGIILIVFKKKIFFKKDLFKKKSVKILI